MHTYPDCDGSGLIARANLEVSTLGNVVEEELEQEVRLLLFEADDVAGEALIDEQRLLSSHRMHPDDRVFRLHRLSTNNTTLLPREVSLIHRRVHGLQPLKSLLKLGGKAVVSLDLRCKEGVAANERGLVEDEEEGGARRLLLVGNVGVPLEATEAVGAAVLLEFVVLAVAVHHVELGVALDIPGCGMALDRPEVSKVRDGSGQLEGNAVYRTYLAISI